MIEREYSSFTSRVRVPRPPIGLSVLRAQARAEAKRKSDEKKSRSSSKSRLTHPHKQKKQQITMRVDSDVLAHFKKRGKGWQTRMNAALRQVAGL